MSTSKAVDKAVAEAIDKIADGVCARVTRSLEASLSQMRQHFQVLSQQGGPLVLPPSSSRAADQRAFVSYEYRKVTPDEIRQVQAAMPGTTWRRCLNGHMYAVGECGSPTTSGRCLECNATVGH
ncbi:hypothetical protein H4R19_000793 [Coemansia spiralis]|nr:hypothetical protein H4R19_000793 [Coemansia spiralis]